MDQKAGDTDTLPLQRVLQWLWQYSMAKTGTNGVLEVPEDQEAECTLNEATCAAAAAQGRLDVLKFLRRQDPQVPWDSQTVAAAACRGNLPLLQWLFSQTCPFDTVAIDYMVTQLTPAALQILHDALRLADHARRMFLAVVACRAVVQQKKDVLDWIAAQHPGMIPDMVGSAALNRPGVIRWLHVSGYLRGGQVEPLSLQEALSKAAVKGDLAGIQSIEAVLLAHDACYRCVLGAHAGRVASSLPQIRQGKGRYIWHDDIHIGDAPVPVANPDHVAVAEWLMDHLPDAQKAQLWSELSQTGIPLLALEMKAHRPENYGQDIVWSAASLSFAAAHARLSALRWLLEQEVLAPEYTIVHKDCSNGRLLLLVHGHGWRLPTQLQDSLASAEKRHLTYYAVVQHQREASSVACLGNLPRDIIKAIACMADLDFSWSKS